MHAALMHHQAHQHLAPAAAAFLIEIRHFPRIAFPEHHGNRRGWRPMSSATSAEQQHPHRRRRRRNSLLAVADTATSDNIPNFEPIITPYTINQNICRATHTTRLEQLVIKHIHALPQYWKNKPTASHNEEAFEYALEFVIRFGSKYENELETVEKSALEGGGVSSPSSSLTITSQSSLRQTNVILDSGCGTGKSTHILGDRYPDCVVIGIDQSLARLNRNHAYRCDTNGKNNNILLLRAEITDFWKFCLASSEWHRHAVIIQQFLLYPNPYPKKSRLMNRFYAHPAFPLLMMTLSMSMDSNVGDGGNVCYRSNKNNMLDSDNTMLVVRSNWKGYLDEFKVASEVWIKQGGDFRDWNAFISNKDMEWHPSSNAVPWEIIGPKQLDGAVLLSPMTNFEAKFLKCGEPVYELSIRKKRRS